MKTAYSGVGIGFMVYGALLSGFALWILLVEEMTNFWFLLPSGLCLVAVGIFFHVSAKKAKNLPAEPLDADIIGTNYLQRGMLFCVAGLLFFFSSFALGNAASSSFIPEILATRSEIYTTGIRVFSGLFLILGFSNIGRHWYFSHPKRKDLYQKRLRRERVERHDERTRLLKEKTAAVMYVWMLTLHFGILGVLLTLDVAAVWLWLFVGILCFQFFGFLVVEKYYKLKD